MSVDPFRALAETEAFWRTWSSRCTYQGRWSEAVGRSLITLKALTYAPTGASLLPPPPPCRRGSRRAQLGLSLLLAERRDPHTAGADERRLHDEARAWREWLLRAVAGSPAQLQIMYGLAGERHLREWEAGWLPGYEGSRPVRVGNAAATQLQLDVFGEVMDALHQPGTGGWPRTRKPGPCRRR